MTNRILLLLAFPFLLVACDRAGLEAPVVDPIDAAAKSENILLKDLFTIDASTRDAELAKYRVRCLPPEIYMPEMPENIFATRYVAIDTFEQCYEACINKKDYDALASLKCDSIGGLRVGSLIALGDVSHLGPCKEGLPDSF